MAKKIGICFVALILCLCCSVCFAANDSNINLGEEVTDSLDKTGDSIRNVADDVMNGIDGMSSNRDNNNNSNNNRSRVNSTTDNTSNSNNSRTGYTGNGAYNNGYNAVRTSVDEMATGTMSTTTWIWIILAVAAIIIVAMVWYYATQTNNNE